MARGKVVIDGVEYVPVCMLQILATPNDGTTAQLVAAAIESARADDAVDEGGGLQRVNRAIKRLKRAVLAFERKAETPATS